MLARLDQANVQQVPLARVAAIQEETIEVEHTYSGRRYSLGPFDSVVLACGATPRDGLFAALKHRLPDVRLIGDAYAPRRMVFATRQAWAVMESLKQER